MSNPADSTCSLLIDETILYSWPVGGGQSKSKDVCFCVDAEWSHSAALCAADTNLRRVTCDNSLKTRRAQLSAKGTFHGSHVWKRQKREKWIKNHVVSPPRFKFTEQFHLGSHQKGAADQIYLHNFPKTLNISSSRFSSDTADLERQLTVISEASAAPLPHSPHRTCKWIKTRL